MVGKTFLKRVAAECEMCSYWGLWVPMAWWGASFTGISGQTAGDTFLQFPWSAFFPLPPHNCGCLTSAMQDVAEEQGEPPAVAPMACQTFPHPVSLPLLERSPLVLPRLLLQLPLPHCLLTFMCTDGWIYSLACAEVLLFIYGCPTTS